MATATVPRRTPRRDVKEYTFLWEGNDRNNRNVRGEMRAASETVVTTTLRRQGIRITKLRRQSFRGGRRVSEKDITFFTRQLATMLKAGVPLLQAFEIVARGHSNARFARLMMDIKGRVEAGSSLSQAFREHPAHFDALYCNLVHAGETAGMLDGILGIFVLFNGLLAGAFAVQSLAGARSEEAGGRLESQLAGSLSRFKWLSAHVLVAASGSAVMLLVGGYLTGASSDGAATGPQLAVAAFAYWPAVLLMIGVLLFLQGFLPRQSTSIAWAVYGVSLLVAMFGGLFSLSDPVIRSTPFGAVPRLPADDFTLVPIVVLTALAAVLAILGIRRFGTRDIVPE